MLMSQVRKLLNGNKIEKHQYGHVIIGSNDYDMNDETIRKDFEQYLAMKGADYGDYLSGVMVDQMKKQQVNYLKKEVIYKCNLMH